MEIKARHIGRFWGMEERKRERGGKRIEREREKQNIGGYININKKIYRQLNTQVKRYICM